MSVESNPVSGLARVDEVVSMVRTGQPVNLAPIQPNHEVLKALVTGPITTRANRRRLRKASQSLT